MASRKHPIPLTRTELAFWKSAFLAAELPVLLKGNGNHLSAIAVAHLAAEYANAAVTEFRSVKSTNV